MTSSAIQTWEQMTLGGGCVRFHSETIGNMSTYWECEDEDCDFCHEYLTNNKENNS